ncbi:DUF1178 family protein [Phaeovulum sp.]|uniref:DUF1178 family protein n=1 Tax=Phaeovulum sp. TaxID=2934796 RepID=UPI0039E57C77
MIRYTLKCDHNHSFDSWFQSTDAFDKLKAGGMIACTVCGSTMVDKELMAPAIRPTRSATATDTPLSSPQSPAEAALATLRAHVEANSDYVGMNFAAEARAMHEGAQPERSIYGEARIDEARALLEEGIQVAPLPFMSARKTN